MESKSTALAIRPDTADVYTPTTLAEAKSLAQMYAASKMLGSYGSTEQVMFVMATGAELGLSPTAALRGLYLVEGKIYMSADLMVALVLRSGLCERFDLLESTADICTYEVQRKGGKPTKFSFTNADAQKAGSRNVHDKFPAVMKRHRCAAQACRATFPDVLLNLYAEEEREEIEVGGNGRTAATGDVKPLSSVTSIGTAQPASKGSEPIDAQLVTSQPVETDEQVIARLTKEIAEAKTVADLTPARAVLETYAKGTEVRTKVGILFNARRKKLSEEAKAPAAAATTAAAPAPAATTAGTAAIMAAADPRLDDFRGRIARASADELAPLWTAMNDAYDGQVPQELVEQYTAREEAGA